MIETSKNLLKHDGLGVCGCNGLSAMLAMQRNYVNQDEVCLAWCRLFD